MGTDPFAELDRQIAAAEAALAVLERRSKRKANWDDPNERLEYIREYKREKRRLTLERLVPGLKCPTCGDTNVKTRSWVVFDRTAIAGKKGDAYDRLRRLSYKGQCCVCRSCAMHIGIWKTVGRKKHK